MRQVLIVLCVLLTTQLARSREPTTLVGAARRILGAAQGVYIEDAHGTVLLAQAADKAVHPASISKVPTTLALLQKFGPEHRFVTTFATTGAIAAGTLEGDLVVACEGDPSFVDESAWLVAQRLGELGIRRIAGGLRIRGSLTFDWQEDGNGDRLRHALAGFIPAAAVAAAQSLQAASAASTAAAPFASTIQFEQAAATTSAPPAATAPAPANGAVRERLLVVHRSEPLLSLVKGLNDYSNNIFKPLAAQAGGAAAVESLARSLVPESMRGEITLGDGAGTDPRNRLSPRAAVMLLRTLDAQLSLSGHHLYDVLPVAGVDDGTLLKRLDGPTEAGRVVGKTGTFGSYGASALVGAVLTSDRGTIYFAILNHAVAVPVARHRQDRFVRALLARLHTVPWNYQRDPRPPVARAQVVTVR